MLHHRSGLFLRRGGSTNDFQLETNQHVLGDRQLEHNSLGWQSGSAPQPPAGNPHSFFETYAAHPNAVVAFGLRNDTEIYEEWPNGVARSNTGPFVSVDPVRQACHQLNSEEAFTATGREPGFANMSMNSGRQMRVVPGPMNYEGTGPAGPVRSLSVMWEFMLGPTFESGHGADRDEDDLLSGGSGWNLTYKFWTLFSGGFRNGKLMEFQTKTSGTYDRNFAMVSGLRYYGMSLTDPNTGLNNPSIDEIIEPHVVSISPIRVDRPEDPDIDRQPSDRTRQYDGARATQTYDDHIAMQQGDVTKPFLITRGEWHAALYQIKYYSPKRVGISFFLSSERTPMVRVFGSRENGGEMIFDSSVHPNDSGLPFSPNEMRWECNSSEGGNHANTSWTPNSIWGRNWLIIASPQEDDFIPATWQPIAA